MKKPRVKTKDRGGKRKKKVAVIEELQEKNDKQHTVVEMNRGDEIDVGVVDKVIYR